MLLIHGTLWIFSLVFLQLIYTIHFKTNLKTIDWNSSTLTSILHEFLIRLIYISTQDENNQ